ncbi:MAG TPA: metallophosphoesterase, partial [Ktedonobacterales bacterium]|nr:metallophosphoesterase [Ktedonobacterales bacterium]
MRAAGRIGIVVTGDNHLSPLLPRLAPERRARRRERLRMGMARAVECALERGARLFVQAGDLFDSPAPSNADRAFVADCLRRLRAAGIECVGIGGNHDTPRLRTEHGGEAPQRVYEAAEVLRYFPRSDALAPVLLTLDGLRLAVVGLSNNPVAAPGSDSLAAVT